MPGFMIASGLFLSSDLAYRVCEFIERNLRSAVHDGVCSEGREVLGGEQDAAEAIKPESAQRPSDPAGKPEFAWGIKKEQHVLADLIALAACP